MYLRISRNGWARSFFRQYGALAGPCYMPRAGEATWEGLSRLYSALARSSRDDRWKALRDFESGHLVVKTIALSFVCLAHISVAQGCPPF